MVYTSGFDTFYRGRARFTYKQAVQTLYAGKSRNVKSMIFLDILDNQGISSNIKKIYRFFAQPILDIVD